MVEEQIRSQRDYYGRYHHHKERMAYLATTLYLAAATAIVIKGPDVWGWGHPLLISLLLFLSAAIGFCFVGWQLRRREEAADIVSACTNVATRLLAPSFDLRASILPKTYSVSAKRRAKCTLLARRSANVRSVNVPCYDFLDSLCNPKDVLGDPASRRVSVDGVVPCRGRQEE